jgi:RNA polymerase sigma-70 factor (ECF subfamily)
MHRDFRRLKPWADTEDVLQSACVRLLRAVEAVPPASAAEFFRLASRQMRRELLDLVRHYYGPEGTGARRARGLPGNSNGSKRGSAQDPSARSDAPESLLAWSQFHEQIERLPAAEREVFGLLWYHRLTQAEAATVLNVSKATVKRWWLAARLRLQEALKDQPPDW